MTRAEIIAELRRSAREEIEIMFSTPYHWRVAIGWMNVGDAFMKYDSDGVRTFFLLVAHALEDEC